MMLKHWWRSPKWCWNCFNRVVLHAPLQNKMSHLMTKSTKWHVHPMKTQISLGLRRVWSESSLCAWRKLGSLATHWAHSEDSDQTGWMPRLIWVFAGCSHFVGFVMRWLKFPCRNFWFWPNRFSLNVLISPFTPSGLFEILANWASTFVTWGVSGLVF